MTHPLDGVRAKLRRANEHRRDFDQIFREFLNDNPYTISVNFDPETGWHDLIWHVWLDPPAERLTLIFGDMLYNLRAVLDHLAWALVLANGGTPTDRTAFPVLRKPEGWAAARGDRLQGVHDTWAAEIEKLQPYHRGDVAEKDLLAILDYVNNVNKHRILPVAVFNASNLAARVDVERMPAGDQLEFGDPILIDRPIERGASAFRFRWIGRQEQLDVNVTEPPTFRVAFRNGLGVGWTNETIFEYVRSVVRLLEPAFPS